MEWWDQRLGQKGWRKKQKNKPTPCQNLPQALVVERIIIFLKSHDMKGTVKLQVHSNTTQQVYIMRECESEIFTYLFYFIIIFNAHSWTHVSKENFHYYALYIDE